MTRTLHVIRHAKSSWDDPALDDRDRPLAPRGRKAAKRVSAWAAAHAVRPELVLCSPALRATQTLDRLLPGLAGPDAPTEVTTDERLYHASASALLERVRALPDGIAEAALIGHNPGLADLCLLLARPGELRDRVAVNLPTAALATLILTAGTWSEAEPGSAELAALVLPRELD